MPRGAGRGSSAAGPGICLPGAEPRWPAEGHCCSGPGIPSCLVIDRWTQRDNDGQVLGEHSDECFYLTKRLDRTATG